MSKQLFLADLAGLTDAEVREHIIREYSGPPERTGLEEKEPEELKKELEQYDILIAYESVGSWGCDSSSFFLLRKRDTGNLCENHGSHCSCNGFEGQFEPEGTTLEYLMSEKFYFCTGGYDEDEEENKRKVSAHIMAMRVEEEG